MKLNIVTVCLRILFARNFVSFGNYLNPGVKRSTNIVQKIFEIVSVFYKQVWLVSSVKLRMKYIITTTGKLLDTSKSRHETLCQSTGSI